MRQASAWLKEVTAAINNDQVGSIVTVSLKQASLGLRIPQESLRRLGQRGQSLGINVRGESLTVKLLPSQSDRRQAYRFLYGLIQAAHQGGGDEILAIQAPPPLLTEMPKLKETLAVLRQGGYLPDEDIRLLSLQLMVYYETLNDKSNLPHWQNVLGSVAG